jgi:hypothetical protein
MATVTKDFKVKSGLVVEGATATVNNYDVLTKKQEDQNYIVDLIGGTATPENTPNTVVKRDGNGNFVANQITANEVVIQTAGSIFEDSGFNIGSNPGNDLNLYGHVGVNITANNADIILNADGTSYLTSATSGNEIATRGYVDGLAGNYDAAGSASAAQTAAQSYADGLASNYDAAGAASTAQSNAASYTDTAITNLNLSGTYDALGAATTALNDAKDYTDQEVAALVDSAPDLLNTLNELAAAIADNPNYATDVANLVATKADTTYVDSEITGAATTAQGYATTAENNAKGYADGLAGNYDAAGSASTAQSNAETFATNAINALDTDAIEEGQNNLYFTNNRVENAIIDPLTLGTQTNISVTYNTGTGAYDFVAENGIADSTTSDLVEGSNLYFTDARAVSALEAVVPNFTEIDLNNIVTNVATQATVATASQVTAHEFDSAVYRSAEYTVKVAYGSHTELSKVIITLDSADNIAITEYAVVGTNGSASTITADVNGGNVRLRVTTANNNSIVTVFGTIIK